MQMEINKLTRVKWLWVPVATMAIGEAGATNAALFALRLLSVDDKAIADALANFAEEQGKIAEESTNELN